MQRGGRWSRIGSVVASSQNTMAGRKAPQIGTRRIRLALALSLSSDRRSAAISGPNPPAAAPFEPAVRMSEENRLGDTACHRSTRIRIRLAAERRSRSAQLPAARATVIVVAWSACCQRIFRRCHGSCSIMQLHAYDHSIGSNGWRSTGGCDSIGSARRGAGRGGSRAGRSTRSERDGTSATWRSDRLAVFTIRSLLTTRTGCTRTDERVSSQPIRLLGCFLVQPRKRRRKRGRGISSSSYSCIVRASGTIESVLGYIMA